MPEEILSQEEIDMLIQASHADLDKGEEEQPESAVYDFRKPNKFSKEHLRALQRIHEHFCRTYSGLMSAKLRSRLSLELNSLEQLTFGEFIRSLPNPSVLTVFNAEPLNGSLVVQLTPDVAFILHDRLCGGPGRPVDRMGGLSEIELAVVRRQVVGVFCQLLKDAWSEVEMMDFVLETIESNPQFLQIAADRDAVVLITLSFELNEVQDMLNICIPYHTLEPLMNSLTQHRLFESLKQPDPEKVKQLREKVRSTRLTVEAELGRAKVDVKDLLTLDVGDVIPLDTKSTDSLDIKIGDLTKFTGTPGKIGQKIGVLITSICDPQGEPENE